MKNFKRIFIRFCKTFFRSEGQKITSISKKLESKKILSCEDGEHFLASLQKIANSIQNEVKDSIEPFLTSLLREPSSPSLDEVLPKIIDIIINLYPIVEERDTGIVLQVISKFSSFEKNAFLFLIEKIKNFDDTNLDTYRGYEAILMIKSYEKSEAERFTSFFSDYEFNFIRFRDIGLIEVFSTWHFANKIENHPIARNLGKLKEFIISEITFEKYSYAVTLIAAMIKIFSDEAKEILRLANEHPSLDVRIEAAYCRAAQEDKEVIDIFINLGLDPRISWQVKNYLHDLKQNFNIEFLEVYKSISNTVINEEFVAQTELCKWLSFITEYGRPSDEIMTLGKIKHFYENNQTEYTIYFINYHYDDEGDGTGYGVMYHDGSFPYARVFVPTSVKYLTVEAAFEALKDYIEDDLI